MIENDIRIHQSSQVGKGTNQAGKKSGATAFCDLLADAVSETSTASQTAAPSQTSAGRNTASLPLVQQITGLLDLFDNYSEALGNENTTLKELAPMLSNLETKANQLTASAQNMGDAELGGLVKQLVAQVQSESIKFHRGDYV